MNTNYQKYYKNKVGSASLNIKKVVAGSKINCRLTYKVGELGIDDSGSLKVLFRIVSDAANPQFENPQADNYVKLSSSRKDIIINIGFASGGLFGKVYERPWSKGFTLGFSGDYLEKGDEVYIDFKSWRMQTFCEDTFEFKVLVDPIATARYVELPKSPEIKIVPDKAKKLVIIAPTLVKTDNQFKILIKLEDRWGNPCTQLSGTFFIDQNNSFNKLPEKIKFERGRSIVRTKIDSELTTHFKARYKKLSAISNPITSVKTIKYNQFWADMHGQSEETVATNDINHYFSFARDYSLLDVAAAQHNDFQVTNKFWKKLNKTTYKFTKNDQFIVFPGYEWSGNTSKGGDRNVLYLNEGEDIYRSSHALINDFSDIQKDASTANDLFKQLKGKKVIAFAHVGGRFANLSMHDEDIERLIEIHSDWGTFEWFLFDALKRGYKIGIVANSDGHTGRPGASYPSFSHFNSYGGLTCILAKNLTRRDIFKALYNRYCYATTGTRIYLDVKCYSDRKYIGMMGDFLTKGKFPSFKIVYKGTNALDRLEIFNKTKIVHTYYPKIADQKSKTIKIVWSGSKVKGRKRSFAWNGKLSLKRNSIKNITKINFYNQKNYVNYDNKSAEWTGLTTGGFQGFVIDLTSKSGNLNLTLNEKKITIPINKISQKQKSYKMGGLDAKVEIYQVSPDDSPCKLELKHNPKLIKGVNPIFVKVTQKDGHMAWSSPIYIDKS